jgi:hypothetical protein
VGQRVLPFEQFDLRYNRPDIVLKRIGYASKWVIKALRKAYKKRLTRLNFDDTQFNQDFHLPTVKLLTQRIPVSTTQKKFTFRLKAEDAKYNLNRLYVFINDTPIEGFKGRDLSSLKTNTYETDIQLKLSDGINKVQVSVMNAQGVESLRQTFDITYEGKTVKPDLYLIAVGVSKYQNTDMNLKYARKDALDIVNLMTQQKSRFNNISVDTLFDEQATTANIQQLKNKLRKTKVDDQVMIFIASHGLLDDQLDYYLGMHHVNFENPSENGLPYAKLESLLDGIPARKKILLMDACHSGEIDKNTYQETSQKVDGSKIVFRGFQKTSKQQTKQQNHLGLNNSFDLMKKMFADLRKSSGATVISAAGGMEFALEGAEWKNGVFTYCLLSGLKNKKADLNQDGKVMLSELQKYLKEQVPKVTNGRQQPTSRVENLSVDFRIW